MFVCSVSQCVPMCAYFMCLRTVGGVARCLMSNLCMLILYVLMFLAWLWNVNVPNRWCIDFLQLNSICLIWARLQPFLPMCAVVCVWNNDTVNWNNVGVLNAKAYYHRKSQQFQIMQQNTFFKVRKYDLLWKNTATNYVIKIILNNKINSLWITNPPTGKINRTFTLHLIIYMENAKQCRKRLRQTKNPPQTTNKNTHQRVMVIKHKE